VQFKYAYKQHLLLQDMKRTKHGTGKNYKW